MSSEPFDRADQAQAAGLGDRLDDLLLQGEAWVARSRTIVAAGLVVAAAAAVAWWALAGNSQTIPVEQAIPLAEPETTEPTSNQPTASQPAGGEGIDDPGGAAPTTEGPGGVDDGPSEVVVVHVVGAVRRPGLVTLEPGDRISDAVAAAGGGRADADVDRLNLASPLVDGMQIRVPVVDETNPVEQPLVQLPPGGGGGGDGGTGGASAPVGPIDLNRAGPAELETLPGIGPALAARIVEWRENNGGFATVDDLEAVPGIGPAKLAEIRDRVVV